jgi:hypothetical protein
LKPSLNRFFSSGHGIPGFIAWAIVWLTLIHLGWLQSRPQSCLRNLASTATNPEVRQQARAPYEDCDRLAAQLVPGNVFLKFVGCSRINSGPSAQGFIGYEGYFLSLWYYRTAYDLYPRRMYVAPPDVDIDAGWDIKFVPAKPWLEVHNVHSVLTLGFDDRGRTLPPHWDPLPPGDDQTGHPADQSGGNR